MKPAFKDFENIVNGRAQKNGKPETFTAANLMALELPEARWAVPGIVPEGVTLLVGKPKLGKSWLTLGLGVATATGGVAVGTKRVEQGECLYLALEDNRRRLQKRLTKLLSGSPAPEGLHIALDWHRLDDGVRKPWTSGSKHVRTPGWWW